MNGIHTIVQQLTCRPKKFEPKTELPVTRSKNAKVLLAPRIRKLLKANGPTTAGDLAFMAECVPSQLRPSIKRDLMAGRIVITKHPDPDLQDAPPIEIFQLNEEFMKNEAHEINRMVSFLRARGFIVNRGPDAIA